MIYSIVGTKQTVRAQAQKEYALLGMPTVHIYSDTAKDIESYLDANSLFGGSIIVFCSQLLETASSKEYVTSLSERMKDSQTIFIIDEPFGTANTFTYLSKISEKIFDAREEKNKDTSVFLLADFFAAKDKKNAWVTFLTVKEKESEEAIAGALWWKFQTIWQATKDGRKTGFTLLECESIGKELSTASIRAHKGEVDLALELERIILSL